MKKIIAFAGVLSLFLVFNFDAAAQSLRGQSKNGSTGLFSIPTGHIGWSSGGNHGLDFGYRAIINNDNGTSHIPAVTLSLFNWIEFSVAVDIQPEHYYNQSNEDLLVGGKFYIPTARNTSIAIGGNIQLINFNNSNHSYNAYQPYFAVTYIGSFFNMTAETTIVFGKTIYSGRVNNSNIDFGMGFDLILFPDVFGNAVHWIIDFANFSYSDNSWSNTGLYHSGTAQYRGVLNTGFRIDLSTIPALSRYKLLIDIVFNDLFDDGQRSFTIGAVFGLPL